MGSAKKVIQTELELKSYNILREVVKRKGISIEEGVKLAIKDWILREADLDRDPFFDTSNVILGSKVTDASQVDEPLYMGKSGP